MRLLTWNCHHGSVDDRLSKLHPLAPDIVSLQEVSRPQLPFADAIWSGPSDSKGLAVASCNPSLRLKLVQPPVAPTAMLVEVRAETPFLLLALWTFPTPTYQAFTLDALQACRGCTLPLVVMGDLNSSPKPPTARKAHMEMVRTLRDAFGLVSAYHAFHGITHGDEAHPTHYWRWQLDAPWHIDFCFIPERWMPKVRTVEVGAFRDWSDSDHRPLMVELEL